MRGIQEATDRAGLRAFLGGLRLAQGITDRKSTMPMLANVLLRTQGKYQLALAPAPPSSGTAAVARMSRGSPARPR